MEFDNSPGRPRRYFTAQNESCPEAGSEAEKLQFAQLQKDFPGQFEQSFPDKRAPKTIIIIPSLSVDREILSKIDGYVHYEERMLCMLMLLRMPLAHVVYLTSMPIDPVIIDYYLHMLPGITGAHARRRLTLLSCNDASNRPLSQKILERPRLIERIKKCVPAYHTAHIACFNVTGYERSLAVRLGYPVFGNDPDLLPLGTKSGSREIFRRAGIPFPPGFENLKTTEEIIQSLSLLKKQHPYLTKAVIKLNDGFSGDGNAIFDFTGMEAADEDLADKLGREFNKRLKVVAEGMSQRMFLEKFESMQGVVEAFIDGEIKSSPSAQCRINPLGLSEILSTHDQILGGENSQIFIGASFPANLEYSRDIGMMSKKVSEELKKSGVLGRFSIDFLSTKQNNAWNHYAIEINLRKGGTTHPFIMLQFLTNGDYFPEEGNYRMPNGQTRYYFTSDNLRNPNYRGLTPTDLIELAIYYDLIYDSASQEGVMFHMIGALSQYGKMGMVCIGSTPERAKSLYDQTVEVLDFETA
jgi:hypothetical protein